MSLCASAAAALNKDLTSRLLWIADQSGHLSHLYDHTSLISHRNFFYYLRACCYGAVDPGLGEASKGPRVDKWYHWVGWPTLQRGPNILFETFSLQHGRNFCSKKRFGFCTSVFSFCSTHTKTRPCWPLVCFMQGSWPFTLTFLGKFCFHPTLNWTGLSCVSTLLINQNRSNNKTHDSFCLRKKSRFIPAHSPAFSSLHWVEEANCWKLLERAKWAHSDAGWSQAPRPQFVKLYAEANLQLTRGGPGGGDWNVNNCVGDPDVKGGLTLVSSAPWPSFSWRAQGWGELFRMGQPGDPEVRGSHEDQTRPCGQDELTCCHPELKPRFKHGRGRDSCVMRVRSTPGVNFLFLLRTRGEPEGQAAGGVTSQWHGPNGYLWSRN